MFCILGMFLESRPVLTGNANFFVRKFWKWLIYLNLCTPSLFYFEGNRDKKRRFCILEMFLEGQFIFWNRASVFYMKRFFVCRVFSSPQHFGIFLRMVRNFRETWIMMRFQFFQSFYLIFDFLFFPTFLIFWILHVFIFIFFILFLRVLLSFSFFLFFFHFFIFIFFSFFLFFPQIFDIFNYFNLCFHFCFIIFQI